MAKSRESLAVERWSALVAYANSNPTSPDFIDHGVAVVYSMFQAEQFGYALNRRSLFNEPFKQSIVTGLPVVRRLLRWLCSGCRETGSATHCGGHASPLTDNDLTPEMLLTAYGHGIHWEILPSDDRKVVPYFFKRRRSDSLLATVCDFLIQELDGFDPGPVPIAVCHRRDCGRFMFVHRSGRKRFCSNLCRVRAQKKSRKHWREYMRAYRANKKRREKIAKLPLPNRRSKREEPKNSS